MREMVLSVKMSNNLFFPVNKSFDMVNLVKERSNLVQSVSSRMVLVGVIVMIQLIVMRRMMMV